MATLLQVVPALIGAFVGAPVLARELETGTFRYAWTQGFGRWRWTLAKLVALAVVVAAAAGALSVLFSWYYQPYFATGNQARSLSEVSPLAPGLFDLRGVAFAAWTLAAFAIGALAGMLIRRVVPAIVATLAAYTGLALAAGIFLRRHYLTPLVTSNPNVPGSAWILSQWWTKGGKFAFSGAAARSTFSSSSAPPSAEGPRGKPSPGTPRAVPRPARLHAVDQLPAGQPVLGIPVDRGRLAARAVSAAHRRDRLARPPPRGLKRRRGERSQVRDDALSLRQRWSQLLASVSNGSQVARRVLRSAPLPSVAVGCVRSAPQLLHDRLLDRGGTSVLLGCG